MAYILSKEIAVSVNMEEMPVKLSENWYKSIHSRGSGIPQYGIVLIAMYIGTLSSPTSKSATAKLIKRK